MNTERPHGIVKDFRVAGDDYLSLIAADLQVPDSLPIMRYLQYIYQKEKKDPTVDALLWDIAYHKKFHEEKSSALLQGFTAEDPALIPLFEETVRAYGKNLSAALPGLSLFELFAGAAAPNLSPDAGTFFLTSRERPQAPAAPATAIVGESGAFLLGYSPLPMRPQNTASNCGVLILPKGTGPAVSFLEASSRFVSEICAAIPEAYVHPCTEHGLISDALQLSDHIVFFTDCIPGAPNVPESCVASYAPGFLLMVPQSYAEYVRSRAQKQGFLAGVPLILSTRKDTAQIFSPFEPLTLTKNHLNSLQHPRGYSVNVSAPAATTAVPLPFVGSADADAEAFCAGGLVYEALASVYSPDCAYAFGLRMQPEHPETVPMLVSLIAFLKNHPVQIAASYAEPAEQNELVIFRLGNRH